MFGWIQLAIAFLQLANKIVDWRRDQGLLQEGEERAYAKALVEHARRTGVVREVEKKFKDATPEQIMRELEGDFRD